MDPLLRGIWASLTALWGSTLGEIPTLALRSVVVEQWEWIKS